MVRKGCISLKDGQITCLATCPPVPVIIGSVDVLASKSAAKYKSSWVNISLRANRVSFRNRRRARASPQSDPGAAPDPSFGGPAGELGLLRKDNCNALS